MPVHTGTDYASPSSEINRHTGPSQEQHVDEIVPIPTVPSPSPSPAHTPVSRNTTEPSSSTSEYAHRWAKGIETQPGSGVPQRRKARRQTNEESEETLGPVNQGDNEGAGTPRDGGGGEDSEKTVPVVEEDQSGLDEYWLSSTGFPLIAATLGPVANLLSVCALVESWRVSATNNDVRIADPPWAYAINGISLAFGIAANLSLVLTFFHQVPYRVSQPFTAVSWFLSALLLVALLIVYIHSPTLNPHILNDTNPSHDPRSKITWSQSYYYAIQSVAVYLLITLLLSVNLNAAYNLHRFPPGLRGLTGSQRTLMFQSTGYMIYLALGALMFSHLESWRFLDAVYWADYTLLTVGIGSDFAPKTTAGRIVVCVYAWGGIVMVGLVIAGVRGWVIEKGKGRMRASTVRKGRRVVRYIVKRKWRRRVEGAEDGVGRVLAACENHHDSGRRRHGGSGDGTGTRTEKAVQKDFKEKTEMVRKKAAWWTEWLGLSYAFIAFFCLWLGGAAVFQHLETEQGWTYGEALYFTNIALLTIGYGDLYPTSQGGKPFFVLWSLMAVPTVTVLISSMQDTIISGFKRGVRRIAKRKKEKADAAAAEGNSASGCEGGDERSEDRDNEDGNDEEISAEEGNGAEVPATEEDWMGWEAVKKWDLEAQTG